MDDYRFNLAIRHYQQGRYEAAIEQLRELLAEDPDNAMYHGQLAGCLIAESRLHAAEYELGLAQRIAPNEPLFLYYRAHLCLLKNKRKQALEFCNEILEKDPEYYDALLFKSKLYMLDDHRKKALAMIQDASSLEPGSIDVTIAFGDYYLDTGDSASAERYCREALSMDASNEDANVLMGKVMLAQSNIADAEYHAKFAIRQNPQSEDALTLFSQIKMRKNIFLGVWWRFNSWASSLGELKNCLLLISAYMFFTLLSQVLLDLDYQLMSKLVSYGWLLLVIYSWVGIPVYYRMLKKELEKFSFNPNF